MEVVKGIQNFAQSAKHAVVTIGNFDGVHLGHRMIIQTALELAKKRGGQCIAYTFRPHPQVALRPGTQVQLLSTYDEKLELLRQAGIDITIEEPFSREFSVIEPEQFFTDVLLRRLNVESIVVGYDFAFGRERHGHLEALGKFCKDSGVELVVVQPHRVGSEVVSSSRIRQHLLSGGIEEANHLLGRPFSYRGVVIKGEGRGRQLGFPTANLQLENKLALPYGVYATWSVIDQKVYPSVTNVGIRPTFQTDHPELPALVETHLLDLNLDLYGNSMEVRFIRKLRDERKFGGVEELKSQILRDIEEARKSVKVSSIDKI
jgi:riboflavin kinase/FMN adenylyltransferase